MALNGKISCTPAKCSFVSILILSLMIMERVDTSRGSADALQSENLPLYTGIITQLQEAEFEYHGQARSERDLETCYSDGPGNAAICSIVYKRYWQPPLVYRLCRCPDRQECPWRWSPPLNNINITAIMVGDQDIDGEPPGTIKSIIHTRDRTMSLNNRSQLKLCQNVRRMPACSSRATAIKIHSKVIPDNIQTSTRISGPKLFLHNQSSIHVTASCKCPQTRYWKYQRTVANNYGNETDGIMDLYACAPLKRCKPMEFCGHISTDSFSTYYQCSCPKGHLCLTQQPRQRVNASEILFTGTAYKAICKPTPT